MFMSKTALSVVAFAALVMVLHGENLLARTLVVDPVVGDLSCQPGIPLPGRFQTIQAAVNAAPAWSTVLVCPGSYPEQVVISQPLILRGVLNGTAGAAIITVPAGGLSLNAPSLAFGGVVAAQLLVQNTAGVRVDHLIVDGSGSTCPAGANRTIGIEFYNVGDASWVNAAGFIANDVVRNEVDGCGLGAAI